MHEFCDNCNRSLRDDETRARGDLNFARMHLIIAHAVRGRYAQRCACYGRWMRTTCAGRSMRGTPTCTRTAALVAGEATGANALQALANSAHATSRTRAIIAVFMCFTACLYRQAGSRVWSSASMRMYYNPRHRCLGRADPRQGRFAGGSRFSQRNASAARRRLLYRGL